MECVLQTEFKFSVHFSLLQVSELTDSFVFTNSSPLTKVTHGKAYVHTPERLVRLDGIMCHACGIKPMKGWRYKCG